MRNTLNGATPRIAIVGIGGQGTGIARLALDDGYEIVGAVDVGEKVGRPLSDFVVHPRLPEVTVLGSIDELLEGSTTPDVVALCALVSTEVTAEMAQRVLERGINVLTLDANMFEGLDDCSQQLDTAARRGGASVLSTGIQDAWWVQLPAVAASSSNRISRIAYDDVVDASIFPLEGGRHEAGLGLTPQEFPAWAAPHLAAPPVQGGPLRALARRLGFAPLKHSYAIHPITRDRDIAWSGADTVIEQGRVTGAWFDVAFPTEQGVDFGGSLRFEVFDGGPMTEMNQVTISGETELVMQFPAVDTMYVPLGLVRRIPDVLAAEPGLLRVEDLPPARYVHSVA